MVLHVEGLYIWLLNSTVQSDLSLVVQPMLVNRMYGALATTECIQFLSHVGHIGICHNGMHFYDSFNNQQRRVKVRYWVSFPKNKFPSAWHAAADQPNASRDYVTIGNRADLRNPLITNGPTGNRIY